MQPPLVHSSPPCTHPRPQSDPLTHPRASYRQPQPPMVNPDLPWSSLSYPDLSPCFPRCTGVNSTCTPDPQARKCPTKPILHPQISDQSPDLCTLPAPSDPSRLSCSLPFGSTLCLRLYPVPISICYLTPLVILSLRLPVMSIWYLRISPLCTASQLPSTTPSLLPSQYISSTTSVMYP